MLDCDVRSFRMLRRRLANVEARTELVVGSRICKGWRVNFACVLHPTFASFQIVPACNKFKRSQWPFHQSILITYISPLPKEARTICDLPSISCSTREPLFDLVKGGLPKVVETGGKSRCKDAHTFRSGLYQELLRVIWSGPCTPTAQECG